MRSRLAPRLLNRPLMLRDCLEHFREACDDLLRLGAEENALLRSGQVLSDAFIDRKRGALGQLDRALQELRSIPTSDIATGKFSSRDLKALVQQKLMQLLLLDRENEQLLLRTSLCPSIRPLQVRPDARKVTNLYEQFASR